MTPLTFIQKFLVKEPTRMWTQYTPPLHVFHSCFISEMGDIQILLLLFISFFSTFMLPVLEVLLAGFSGVRKNL